MKFPPPRICAQCGESNIVMVLMRGSGTQKTPQITKAHYLCTRHWQEMGK